MSHGDAATSALLAEVFPGTRVARPDYLRWLYRDSPFGAVVECNLDDEQGRAGHYAVVPVDLAVDGSVRPAALSLNTAVHPRARGGGTFVRLATATFEVARAQGIEIVVGVANANSTPGFLRRLDFELLTPLPAQVIVPVPGRPGSVRSGWAADAAFAGAALDDAALAPLLQAPARGIARAWTPTALRWRLCAPGTRFALHRGPGMLMVSTSDVRRDVRVAVIAKVFVERTLDGAAAAALVRAACRTHRAPLALHLGINDGVSFRGLALPERLRPSPLNLIFRALDGTPRSAQPVRFEALDFDAY